MTSGGRASAATAPLRVVERELRVLRQTWRGTTFSVFVAPLLMLVALGLGVGGMIDDPVALGGIDYLAFLTPGLMVGAAAQMGATMSLWQIMAGHRWIGHHRALVATSLGPRQLAAGYLAWVFTRGVAQAVVFLLVGWALGGVNSLGAAVSPLVAGLTAIAVGAPVMAYSASADSDAGFDPILRVGITPLYLFSGSFFPTSQLPDAVEQAVRLLPIWHGIELARGVSTATSPALPIAVHLAVLALWIGGGWWLADRRFAQRLTP